MGFNVYVTNGEEKYYLERNVTYNFSTDNYMKYWYILNDLHKKTVEETIKSLEIATSRLIQEGITPELGRRKDDLHSFLWVLLGLYSELIYFNRNFIVVAE